MQNLHHAKELDNVGAYKITLYQLLDRRWGKPKIKVVSDEAGYVQALRTVLAELEEQPDNSLVYG